jgi:BCD family chlorophyll transporter-like MFS transporter
MSAMLRPLGWAGIFRLALVQTALGSIIVLTTSTMNRVMVVEMALPALVPGVLVALHHVVQLLRPRLGHGSDVGGRRTPWIVGGMATLAAGGVAAAIATAWMATDRYAGTLLGVVAFVAIGIGAGAAGTSLLVLMAKRVDPTRRAAAATIAWVMMIAGFIVTAGTAGHFLDPFSPERLVLVTSIVAVVAFAVALIAVQGIEPARGLRGLDEDAVQGAAAPAGSFRAALLEAWSDPQSRRFTMFVFVSMLAYSMQDLILEPFAGIVFGMTPGASTKLAGLQNAGVLLGMVVVGVLGTWRGKSTAAALRGWCLGGCVASALALFALLSGALDPQGWPLRANVFALGVANGAFAVAAIGSMMALAAAGRSGREGVRMGLWGASQAIAFALGGVLGTAAVDVARLVTTDAAHAYGLVFGLEACVFLWAALLAGRREMVTGVAPERGRTAVVPTHLPYVREAVE